MPQSRIRQNYHADAEDGVNKHINMVLHASYTYMGMAYYFDRDDVALPHVHKYFDGLAHCKREMADKLMRLQNSRGGRVLFDTVKKPAADEWGSVIDVFRAAVKMEQELNTSADGLHSIASRTGDAHLSDFVEEELLEAEVCLIKKLGDHLSNAERVGPSLGEFMFDHENFD